MRNNKLILQDIKIEENYLKLHASGMMWVYFPEFTGLYKKDMEIVDALLHNMRAGNTITKVKQMYMKEKLKESSTFMEVGDLYWNWKLGTLTLEEAYDFVIDREIKLNNRGETDD